MTETIYSVRVWLRRTPRGRWRPWQSFADGVSAATAIREAKNVSPGSRDYAAPVIAATSGISRV